MIIQEFGSNLFRNTFTLIVSGFPFRSLYIPKKWMRIESVV